MTGSTCIPSLAELFNEKPSVAETNDSSNLPSLSELLKSTENAHLTPLSNEESADKFKSSNFGFNSDLPLSLSNQCCVPSLSELSLSNKLTHTSELSNCAVECGNFTSLNEFGSSPTKFTSLSEFSNSPGKLSSLNELSKSPGKFTSLNELSSSPGKFTSLNELSTSSGKFTSLNELSNSPGKFTSHNELSNSPGKFTSLNELSNSPGKFTSLNDLSNSPGKFTSLNEFSNSPGMLSSSNQYSLSKSKNVYKPKENVHIKQLKDDTAVHIRQMKNESSLTGFKWNGSLKNEKSNAGYLPTLLNLLSVENDGRNNFDNSNDQNVISELPGLYGNNSQNLNSLSCNLVDHRSSSSENSMVAKLSGKKIVKTHNSNLLKPSNFSKVVGAKLDKTNHRIDTLHNELKQTDNQCSLTEVILTNIPGYDIDTDKIFAFSTPSPDDIILSCQKKAFKRD